MINFIFLVLAYLALKDDVGILKLAVNKILRAVLDRVQVFILLRQWV